MKKSKVYLSLAIVALIVSGFASAQETGTVDTSTNTTGTTTDTGVVTNPVITTTGAGLATGDIKNGFSKIRGSWKMINQDFGYAKKFFQKGLTGDLLSGSKAIIKEKNTAIKTLNQELKTAITSSGVIDWDGIAQKYIDVYTSFKTNAVPYVNPTKLEAFNKYIDAKIATVKKALEYRKNIITKKEIAHKKLLEKKAEAAKKLLEKKAEAAKKLLEKKEEHKSGSDNDSEENDD